MSGLRLDPSLPARLARLAAFASRCGSVAHEAMSAHCEVAADFAAGLGFGHHVQDTVHYQYERHDGRSPAFHRRAETIPRPAKILHLALAADLVRGLSGAEAAAAMVSRRTGTYFDPDVAEAYLDLVGGLWPPGDEPVPLTDVLSRAPGIAAQGPGGSLEFYWQPIGSGQWNPEQPAGPGTTYSAPSVAHVGNNSVIAATRDDGSLWFYWQPIGSEQWNPEQVAGTGTTG